jgi:methylenetetrahydrofolate dehydrogenase (NADP+) / methenyltetrahydrofolate cyclohydrolase
VVLDGKLASYKMIQSLKLKLSAFLEKFGKPRFAIIQVGNNCASNLYISNKKTKAKLSGIEVDHFVFKEDDFANADKKIEELNNNDDFHGIILQLPVSEKFQCLINKIKKEKDIDALGFENNADLMFQKPGLRSCTPSGVISLLDLNNIEIANKHVAIVGRSNLVGKPLALMMLERDATVSILHSKSDYSLLKHADIVVLGVGSPYFFKAEMFSSHAVVIDVGISFLNCKLAGDLSPCAYDKVAAYSPVPGGVGPMTIASLLQNVAYAFAKSNNLNVNNLKEF